MTENAPLRAAIVRSLARRLVAVGVPTVEDAMAATASLRFETILCDLSLARDGARILFAHVVQLDPNFARAFLLMAASVQTQRERDFAALLPCLELPCTLPALETFVLSARTTLA